MIVSKFRFILLLLLIISPVSFAASIVGTASVRILEVVELSEKKVIDFGGIKLQDGTCSLGNDGKLLGSNGAACEGSGQMGEIQIAGSADQSVSISVSSLPGSDGLSFTPELHSDSSTTLTEGIATAVIGGDLNIDGASAGSHTLSYVVVVNYD